jgi:hypothetical protein
VLIDLIVRSSVLNFEHRNLPSRDVVQLRQHFQFEHVSAVPLPAPFGCVKVVDEETPLKRQIPTQALG